MDQLLAMALACLETIVTTRRRSHQYQLRNVAEHFKDVVKVVVAEIRLNGTTTAESREQRFVAVGA